MRRSGCLKKRASYRPAVCPSSGRTFFGEKQHVAAAQSLEQHGKFVIRKGSVSGAGKMPVREVEELGMRCSGNSYPETRMAMEGLYPAFFLHVTERVWSCRKNGIRFEVPGRSGVAVQAERLVLLPEESHGCERSACRGAKPCACAARPSFRIGKNGSLLFVGGLSAARYTTGRYIVAVPVADGKRFDAYAGSGLRTVNEVVLSDVDAGVIARPGNSEHHDVAGAKTAARNALACAGLIATDAGNVDAVSGTGPVHETGAVEAFGRRGASGNVGAAQLTFGRGGNGRAAAGGNAALLRIGRSVGLLAAARHCDQSREEKQKKEAAMQSMDVRSRHGDPAVGLMVQYFLCMP